MFTGIIETLGTVTGTRHEGTSIVLFIEPDADCFDIATGASVAIDGVCLTLETPDRRILQFRAVAETLNHTTLYNIRNGRRVNLERAAMIGQRFDGHLVYGHVDGVGRITGDREMNGSLIRTVSIPAELSRYMALKGSVALDGISLTIARSDAGEISISFIPHTLATTTMAKKRPGDAVNIECDIVARYLDHLLHGKNRSGTPSGESLLTIMERSGF